MENTLAESPGTLASIVLIATPMGISQRLRAATLIPSQQSQHMQVITTTLKCAVKRCHKACRKNRKPHHLEPHHLEPPHHLWELLSPIHTANRSF